MKRPLCILCLAFVVMIAIAMQFWKPPSFSLGENDGNFVILTGEITSKQTNQNNLIIYLSNVTFQIKSNLTKQTMKSKVPGVVCYVDSSDDILLGSEVTVSGIAKEFSIATNPGEFHQQRFQQMEGYFFSCIKAKVIRQSKEYSKRKELLHRIKRNLSQSIENSFSKENAGIMKAIFLGEKQELDKDIKRLYQRNGISHILAISGLHISILGMAIFRILRRLRIPLTVNALLTIVFLSQYGSMTGMGVSCKRAIIMFFLLLAADFSQKTYDILTAMAFSAVCILIYQPQYLYHSGFLLSFSAIMGIALVVPIFSEFFPKLKIVLSSAAISLATLPIQMLFFYEFSLHSVLLNLVVIPCVTVLLSFGIVTAVAGLFFSKTAFLLAVPVNVILYLFEKLCYLFETYLHFPDAVGSPSIIKAALYYTGLLILIFTYQKLGRLKTMLCFIALVGFLCIPLPHNTRITFLDVGQGDASCIQSKSGKTYIIDAGSIRKDMGTYQMIPFLKYSGVREVEAIFLSHMDEDHISAAAELLETISIKKMVVSHSAKEHPNFKEIRKKAAEAGTRVYYIKKGDCLKEEALTIECLAPDGRFTSKEENENSMLLKVTIGKRSILFTGDIEGEGEKNFLKHVKKEKVDILKIAHHGSRNGSSQLFLDKIKSDIAVISAGRGNMYGHPHTEVIERLKNQKIYITKENGAIIVDTDGKKMKIKTFIENPLDFSY